MCVCVCIWRCVYIKVWLQYCFAPTFSYVPVIRRIAIKGPDLAIGDRHVAKPLRVVGELVGTFVVPWVDHVRNTSREGFLFIFQVCVCVFVFVFVHRSEHGRD